MDNDSEASHVAFLQTHQPTFHQIRNPDMTLSELILTGFSISRTTALRTLPNRLAAYVYCEHLLFFTNSMYVCPFMMHCFPRALLFFTYEALHLSQFIKLVYKWLQFKAVQIKTDSSLVLIVTVPYLCTISECFSKSTE